MPIGLGNLIGRRVLLGIDFLELTSPVINQDSWSTWSDWDSPQTPMPSQWDFRYHQSAQRSGQQVQLLQAVANGIWTCVDPQLRVTSINLKSKSGVSTLPRAAVDYSLVPPLTNDQKQVAVASS